VCGVGWYFVPQPADQLSASMENAGSEGGHARHLVVFTDAKQAAAAMQQFQDAPANCAGVFTDEGLRYEMFPADAGGSGADEASAWVQGLHDETSLTGEGSVTVAQRVGNAVLVDTAISMGVGDPSVREEGVQNLLRRDEQVLAQMCVFSAAPCATPPGAPNESPDPTRGEGALSAIPAGLELDRGLSSPEGDPVDGPSATSEGVPALDLCGTSVWPVTGVERLAVTVTGPEYRESRELVTIASSADLTAALDALRSVADASCAPEGQVLTPFDEQVGDDAVTFAITYEGGLGLDIYQFVQVGRSLLATHRYTEGSIESAQQSVPDVTKANQDLVPDLCPFTERGC